MKLATILSCLGVAVVGSAIPNNATDSRAVASSEFDRCDPCNIYYAACFVQCNEGPTCHADALCAECTNDCLIETCLMDNSTCYSCMFPYC